MALHLPLEHGKRVAVRLQDRHVDMDGAFRVLVAATLEVECELADARIGEIAVDRIRQARRVERTGQLRDVHRVVRVRGAPAQHRRLEDVETALHGASAGVNGYPSRS